jgi:hypothetical protein
MLTLLLYSGADPSPPVFPSQPVESSRSRVQALTATPWEVSPVSSVYIRDRDGNRIAEVFQTSHRTGRPLSWEANRDLMADAPIWAFMAQRLEERVVELEAQLSESEQRLEECIRKVRVSRKVSGDVSVPGNI